MNSNEVSMTIVNNSNTYLFRDQRTIEGDIGATVAKEIGLLSIYQLRDCLETLREEGYLTEVPEDIRKSVRFEESPVRQYVYQNFTITRSADRGWKVNTSKGTFYQRPAPEKATKVADFLTYTSDIFCCPVHGY